MDKYAVIGNPVEHSLSPIIHEAFAKQTKQKFIYSKIEAPLDGFVPTVQQFITAGGKGLNVTLPFKHEAYQLSTNRSKTVEEAQAASVLHFRTHQEIYADNFDGFGMVQDLTCNYQIKLTQQKILVLGAGGAAQGILGPLLDQSPAQVVIANRTGDKAHHLATKFRSRGPVQGISFAELKASPYDVIIHVTSIGHQNQALTLPDGLITADTCCYDISYGKAAQTFLNWAKMQGAKKYFDGLGMLVEHNAAVFYLWFGIHPDTQPVIKMLRTE
jgi:shikimate dehydrogenase